MVTNPASLFLPLLPFQCAAPAWTQGLTTPLFFLFFLVLFLFLALLQPLMSHTSPPPLCLSFLLAVCLSSRSASPSFSSRDFILPQLHSYIFTLSLTCELQFSFSCILFIFPLFLFQCEAVLWSFAVDPGDSDWSRLRLPPPSPTFLPLSDTSPSDYYSGSWVSFLNFIFVFFNEINVQHSCA